MNRPTSPWPLSENSRIDKDLLKARRLWLGFLDAASPPDKHWRRRVREHSMEG